MTRLPFNEILRRHVAQFARELLWGLRQDFKLNSLFIIWGFSALLFGALFVFHFSQLEQLSRLYEHLGRDAFSFSQALLARLRGIGQILFLLFAPLIAGLSFQSELQYDRWFLRRQSQVPPLTQALSVFAQRLVGGLILQAPWLLCVFFLSALVETSHLDVLALATTWLVMNLFVSGLFVLMQFLVNKTWVFLAGYGPVLVILYCLELLAARTDSYSWSQVIALFSPSYHWGLMAAGEIRLSHLIMQVLFSGFCVLVAYKWLELSQGRGERRQVS